MEEKKIVDSSNNSDNNDELISQEKNIEINQSTDSIGKKTEKIEQTNSNLQENEVDSTIIEEKEVEEISEIEMLKNEVAEWKDKFLRKMAEFENYKKRVREEQIQLINYSNEKLIRDLLAIVDDFERTLNFSKEDLNNNPVLKGVEMVYSKLMKVLSNYGLKKIEALNQPFDFNYHEALLQVPKEGVEPLTVVEEIQKGYMLHDRVLRHSKVIVSSDVKIEDQPSNNSEEESN